jgi:hypothetical protein
MQIPKGKNEKELNLVYVENRSFCPHPKSLSQDGRGTTLRLPFSQIWEKGLGDEGFFFSYGKNYSFQDGRGLIEKMYVKQTGILNEH